MDDKTEKIYCYDKDNSAMWATLMANNRDKTSPIETLALMNGGMGGGMWNNPLK